MIDKNRQTLIWQLIVFLLGLILVLSIRDYLQKKIRFEVEKARVDCIVETNYNEYCDNIKFEVFGKLFLD